MTDSLFMQSGMLVDQLKSVAARNTLISSKLPSGEARTVQSHSGACYALAFDRYVSPSPAARQAGALKRPTSFEGYGFAHSPQTIWLGSFASVSQCKIEQSLMPSFLSLAWEVSRNRGM